MPTLQLRDDDDQCRVTLWHQMSIFLKQGQLSLQTAYSSTKFLTPSGYYSWLGCYSAHGTVQYQVELFKPQLDDSECTLLHARQLECPAAMVSTW